MLSERMRELGRSPLSSRKRTGPLWEGPSGEGPNGGITFSLLSKFLVCRARFYLTVVKGLKPMRTFNHKMFYGDLWHAGEEALADEQDPFLAMRKHAQKVAKEYPTSGEQVDHWFQVAMIQFPLYIDFWKKHPDVASRKPLLEEEVFDVPYLLPSGRTVRLRGKWDSVDLVTKGVNKGVWLQENKTKGQVIPHQLQRQLRMDVQSMIYMVALHEGKTGMAEVDYALPIRGIRYNVIRRPLSGGKGTIVRHKPSKKNPRGESKQEYYKRVAQYIVDEPQGYFMRWDVPVTDKDVETFRRTCLDPVLDMLCEWWAWVSRNNDPFHELNRCHFVMPFGIRSPLLEGGSTDTDEAVFNGSTAGLHQVDTLFPELGV